MKRLLPLILVAAGVAAPASAQIVDRVIGYATPGQAYVNYSYGSFDKVYNNDSKEVNDNGTTTLQRAAIGGSYNVAQAGDLGVYVGVEFAMASSKKAMTTPNTTIESGFKPQSVGVGVGVRGPSYSFGVAYQHDLGPKYELSGTTLSIPNSDQSPALALGAEAYTPFAGFTMTAGANYYLTLKKDQSLFVAGSTTPIVTASVDPADYLDVHVGAAYRVADIVELGLQARYLKTFEGSATVGNTTSTTEKAGYAIGVVPYLTLSPESIPAQITISGSTTREYTPYGLTLGGQNLPVGRAGVTVGLRYGF